MKLGAQVRIAIEKSSVEECLRKASEDKYSAYRDVANQIGVSPTGLNYWNVATHIPRPERDFVSDVAKGYALRDQLKMSADVSRFAKTFTQFMDASRDVDILTRLSNSNGRTFPTFHSFGTITSRVLVSDPHLQELRRKFRRVISADDGYHLQYFDYSQFEPGIMASLSEDDDLIALYNRGDIYSALSSRLFGTTDHRDLCKKIFLAFSYGMNASGISRLLSGDASDSNKRLATERKVTAFFEKFARLSYFKQELEVTLMKDGRIATPLGNNRYRRQDGRLSARERRWATSQRIQGTASLIFKTAILALSSEFGNRSIVLPMHDAVLMQFPINENLDKKSEKVGELMIEAFSKWCPSVRARVTQGNFI